MTFYHDNKLTMVGLDSDSEGNSYAPLPSAKRKRFFNEPHFTMSEPASNVGALDGRLDTVQQYEYTYPDYSTTFDSSYEDTLPTDYGLELEMNQDFSFPFNDDAAHNMPDITADADRAQASSAVEEDSTVVKSEDGMQHLVSLTPNGGSEYDESEYDERRPSKVPKVNKDGVPRKPRQPRPKLLKWDDNDWKNVALGLVWACGENGIQIPFDQASQVVSESCTAGALQQALLKLRGKQVAEGFQIPTLRMAWTRKNKNASSSFSANTKSQQATDRGVAPKKKPTRFSGSQCKIIVLKRAYKDADRRHLAAPYRLTKALSRARVGAANMRSRLAMSTYDPTAVSETSSSAFSSSSNGLPVMSALDYPSLTLPSYHNVGTPQHCGRMTGNVPIPLSPQYARLASEPHYNLWSVKENDEEHATVDGELGMTAQPGLATPAQHGFNAAFQDIAATSAPEAADTRISNAFAVPVQDVPVTPTRYESATQTQTASAVPVQVEPVTPVQNAPATPVRKYKHRRTESITGFPTPTTPTYVGPYDAMRSGRSSYLGTQQSDLGDGGLMDGLFQNQGFSYPDLTNQGSKDRGPVRRGLPDQGDYDEDGNLAMSYSNPNMQKPFRDFSGFHL